MITLWQVFTAPPPSASARVHVHTLGCWRIVSKLSPKQLLAREGQHSSNKTWPTHWMLEDLHQTLEGAAQEGYHFELEGLNSEHYGCLCAVWLSQLQQSIFIEGPSRQATMGGQKLVFSFKKLVTWIRIQFDRLLFIGCVCLAGFWVEGRQHGEQGL